MMKKKGEELGEGKEEKRRKEEKKGGKEIKREGWREGKKQKSIPVHDVLRSAWQFRF